MGREIRRVPPNWNHPKNRYGNYQSMIDKTFEAACTEWEAGLAAWVLEDHEETYWEYEGLPPNDRSYYRPWIDKEATWYQLWETVSEGSPVSPPFETKEELSSYLAEHGDFWDHGRGWGHRRATAFMEDEWAPSMAMVDGRMYEAKDIPLLNKDTPSSRG